MPSCPQAWLRRPFAAVRLPCSAEVVVGSIYEGSLFFWMVGLQILPRSRYPVSGDLVVSYAELLATCATRAYEDLREELWHAFRARSQGPRPSGALGKAELAELLATSTARAAVRAAERERREPERVGRRMCCVFWGML